MKLLRYGIKGKEKPAILDAEGVVRDLSNHIDDISGDTLSDAQLHRLASIDTSVLPVVVPERIGSCVGSIGKFICIGLNYSDHAEESDLPIPTEPIVFLKATSAICGPNDNVEIPLNSTATDWEVELGIVIGKHTKNVSEIDALSHIAGYCVINDISERDFQHQRQGQWTKGKSADTFGPMGPWLVTRDEISNPQNLLMSLDVNGKRMQTGSTNKMIFGVAFIVSYLSRFMSLHPGDVISTGTPPGVGAGMKPKPTFLIPGDRIKLSIQKLGTQNQLVVQGE